jgi:hypothetical protein
MKLQNVPENDGNCPRFNEHELEINDLGVMGIDSKTAQLFAWSIQPPP